MASWRVGGRGVRMTVGVRSMIPGSVPPRERKRPATVSEAAATTWTYVHWATVVVSLFAGVQVEALQACGEIGGLVDRVELSRELSDGGPGPVHEPGHGLDGSHGLETGFLESVDPGSLWPGLEDNGEEGVGKQGSRFGSRAKVSFEGVGDGVVKRLREVDLPGVGQGLQRDERLVIGGSSARRCEPGSDVNTTH